VRALVREQTQGRGWGLFGEQGVNVLMLNIALDKAVSQPPGSDHQLAQQGR
jgi:hypothetical protein